MPHEYARPPIEKDNRTHRLLRELIKGCEKNQYLFKYEDMTHLIHPRIIRWYYIRKKERPIYEVRGLFEQLSADQVLQGAIGEFETKLIEKEDLYRIRNTYAIKRYREPIWISAIYFATILTALSSIGQVAVAYFSDVSRSADTEQLEDLHKQREQIGQLMREMQVKNDSLRLLEMQNDSLRRTSKRKDKKEDLALFHASESYLSH